MATQASEANTENSPSFPLTTPLPTAVVALEPLVAATASEEVPAEATTVIEPAAIVVAAAEIGSVSTEPVASTPVVEEAAAAVEVTEEPVVAEPVQSVPSTPPITDEAAPEVAAAPAIDIDAALADSGLVLVQTTAATTAPAVVEPPQKLGRPRKTRTAPAEAEAMVMVETAPK